MNLQQVAKKLLYGSGALASQAKDILTGTMRYESANAGEYPKKISASRTYSFGGSKLTDEDFKAIRPILFGEIGNRSLDKQELEARTILGVGLNRLTDPNRRWKADSLASVFTQPKQFQGYDPSNPKSQYNQYLNPQDEPTRLKKQQLDSIFDKLETEIKAGEYQHNVPGSYFYTHQPDGRIIATEKEPSYNK